MNFLPMAQQLLVGQASRLHSRHTTLGRTPLDEWSAGHRDLYRTTYNSHNRYPSRIPCQCGYQTEMKPQAVFMGPAAASNPGLEALTSAHRSKATY